MKTPDELYTKSERKYTGDYDELAAKAARRAAWPAAQACALQRFAQSGNRPFSHYKIGAAFWRCKRQVEREGTLQEPAQSETQIFGQRTNEGKVGRKNTLQKVPYPAMIKGRTT